METESRRIKCWYRGDKKKSRNSWKEEYSVEGKKRGLEMKSCNWGCMEVTRWEGKETTKGT